MQFVTAKRRGVFLRDPQETVLLERALRERLTRHRCQVHQRKFLGYLAHARVLFVEFAEDRSEALLKQQEVLLTEESLVLTGGLES